MDKDLDEAIKWANNLLNYACASNRHILIKDYAKYLDTLLKAAQASRKTP